LEEYAEGLAKTTHHADFEAMSNASLPVIDIAPLLARQGDRAAVAKQIAAACRAHGFFYISGHGIPDELIQQLEGLSHRFFAWSMAEKMAYRMALSGRAWRGYFPPAGELTSGRPDWKEGLYLGADLPADHILILARTPLHGANLYPALPGFQAAIDAYMSCATLAAHALMEGIALSLGLPDDYFAARYTSDPLLLFRIFNYPSQPLPDDLAPDADAIWGVGEHTDYGLLTLLYQDHVGGLQVKSPDGWIEAPPIPGTLVCNIGDMLDRMTGGHYRSTPHRVRRNTSCRERLSFPLFFDPNFFAHVRRIEGLASVAEDDSAERWDRANVHAFGGSYGDYVLAKVGKVFPELKGEVLD
jgi:isopenicillin N synthase-like dioxygenase